MEKSFIKIGSHYLSLAHIIEIDVDCIRQEHQMWEEEGAQCRGYRPVHYVRIITAEIYGDEDGSSTSTSLDFKHETPEAQAVIRWLEDKAEVLI